MHEAELKLPVPAPDRVKSTEPDGLEAVPDSVSSTVAVHTVPWSTATVAGTHVTVVAVVRFVTDRSNVSALVSCVELPPYEPVIVCVPSLADGV